MRLRTFFLAACGFLIAAAAGPAVAQDNATTPLPQWSKSELAEFAELPLQDGGRIKPLNTYARFKLIEISGRKTFRDADGKTHSALEWLAEALFDPAQAQTYPVFLVDSGAVMEALGLPHEKPRDRYPYNVLAPARDQLYSQAQSVAHVDAGQRTTVQNQILRLAQNVHDFEKLMVYLQFARHTYSIEGSNALAQIFPDQKEVSLSDVIEHGPDIIAAVMKLRSQGDSGDAGKEAAALSTFLQAVETNVTDADALALIPPAGTDKQTPWTTPADMFSAALQGKPVSADQLTLLRRLETMARSTQDPATFRQAEHEFYALATSMAKDRGEYRSVPLEVRFYQAKFMGVPLFFSLTLFLYVIAFLVAAVTWLTPRSNKMTYVAMAALAVPFALTVVGIGMRCVIRLRPPVTTLYETILFITAVAVFLSLCTEFFNRRKIAVSLGAFLGVLGIFLANRYEAMEGTDTMPMLVAVLDTNFWLWTHVTTVTIGYAAGLLAGAVAHVYLIGKALGLRQNRPDFYAAVTRMTYGVMCFGLLFSTLGTVLGGIWANESWGRFWGWDPKENGALMIVLWELAVLHASAGRLIGPYGFNMAAVAGSIIVAFSWFGVNLLGVGLHSYGFTSGVQRGLMIFYIFESIILLIGAIGWIRERGPADSGATRQKGKPKAPRTPASNYGPAK